MAAPGPPEIVWAARYTASVTVDLEESSLRLNDGLPHGRLRGALATPPEWTLDPWDASEADLERLALDKLKALLDFDAGLGANSSAEIRQALDERFPEIAAARRLKGSATVFKRFEVTALVLADDGAANWELVTPSAGDFAPGLGPSLDSGAPLKVFVQNLIRADLLTRLGR